MNPAVHIAYYMAIGVPAMVLHECGHIVAARCCRVKVKRVGVSRRGIYTVREPGTREQNITISLAGPGTNLLLAIALWPFLPTFAGVNFVAGVYNLLPVRNSDGSRALALRREP